MVRRAAAAAAAIIVFMIPLALTAAPLRDGDRVSVTVLNHPDLTIAQGTIDGDGLLALPLAGNVSIAGSNQPMPSRASPPH